MSGNNPKDGTQNEQLTFATIVATGFALAALGLAAPLLAADNASGQGTVALPPGGPDAVFPQDQITGGANPYTPFGTDPDVPYGV